MLSVLENLFATIKLQNSGIIKAFLRLDEASCYHNSELYHLYERVSMGLTVSRKTAKNLAVRRKNERILTVSRKKMLTVKKSNHKIRSRVLLLSLMCYAFMCSGSENFNRNRKCRKCLRNLSHGCRCAS